MSNWKTSIQKLRRFIALNSNESKGILVFLFLLLAIRVGFWYRASLYIHQETSVLFSPWNPPEVLDTFSCIPLLSIDSTKWSRLGFPNYLRENIENNSFATPTRRHHLFWVKGWTPEWVESIDPYLGEEFFLFIDLNSASQKSLQEWFWISPKVAQTMVRFRDSKNGFTQVSEAYETYGFPKKRRLHGILERELEKRMR